MPSVDGKHESEDEEMDQDTPDSEKSEDEDSEMSGSDVEGSSGLDEGECEQRRGECIDDMADLEKQFVDLKEQLYRERMQQIETKLEEVKMGRATEYIRQLAELQDMMRIRTHVAGILKQFRVVNIKNKYECESQAAEQNFQSEKALLYDTVKSELEEKIRRLEEDRHNIDISSDLWNESQQNQKKKRKPGTDSMDLTRRRKPVTVSGPYIVYLLKESDIIEDWTAIRKALKQQMSQRRKPDYSKGDRGKWDYFENRKKKLLITRLGSD